MMKRIIAFMISMIMILGCVVIVPVTAADNLTLTVNAPASAKPGDTITVTVDVADLTATIFGVTYKIGTTIEGLTFVSAEPPADWTSIGATGAPTIGGKHLESATVPGNAAVSAYWSGGVTQNINGTFVTLTYKVDEDATGTINIPVVFGAGKGTTADYEYTASANVEIVLDEETELTVNTFGDDLITVNGNQYKYYGTPTPLTSPDYSAAPKHIGGDEKTNIDQVMALKYSDTVLMHLGDNATVKAWDSLMLGTSGDFTQIGFRGWVNPAANEAGGNHSEPITKIGYQLDGNGVVWIDGTDQVQVWNDITLQNRTTAIEEDAKLVSALGGATYARRFTLWIPIDHLAAQTRHSLYIYAQDASGNIYCMNETGKGSSETPYYIDLGQYGTEIGKYTIGSTHYNYDKNTGALTALDGSATGLSRTQLSDGTFAAVTTSELIAATPITDSALYSYPITVSHTAGHTLTWQTVTEATCTTYGSAKLVCAEGCAINEVTSVIDMVAHTWVDANCTTAKSCSACGTTEGTALGHDTEGQEWEITRDPTFEQDGERIRRCKRCNEIVETESVPFVCDHSTTHEETTQYPTCVATGLKKIVCNTCGVTTQDNIVIPVNPENHENIDEEWTITVQATASANGTKVKYCQDCDEIAKSMSYAYVGANTILDVNFSSDMVIDLGGSNVVITGSGNTLTQQSFIADPLYTGGDAEVNIDNINLWRYYAGAQQLNTPDAVAGFKTWDKVSMGTNIVYNSIELIGIKGWLNPAANEAGGNNNEPITQLGFQLGNGAIEWIEDSNGTQNIDDANTVNGAKYTSAIWEDNVGSDSLSSVINPNARRFVLWLNVSKLVSQNTICSLYLYAKDSSGHIYCMNETVKGGSDQAIMLEYGNYIVDSNGSHTGCFGDYTDGTNQYLLASDGVTLTTLAGEDSGMKAYTVGGQLVALGSDDVINVTKIDNSELYTGKITVNHDAGHTLTLVSDGNATCSTYGTATLVCSDANCTTCPTLTSVVDKTAHTPKDAVQENVHNATCGADGSYESVVYCSVCGAEISRTTETIPATGEHTESKAVIENNIAADCTNAGSYDSVVYCSVCGEEMSRQTITVEALGHTPAEAVKESIVAATCTNAGSYDSVVYCSVCGDEMSRQTITVPATGHTDGDTVIEKKTDATCNKAGSYESVVYCAVCGEEISRTPETIPATGEHKDTNGDGVCDNGDCDYVIYIVGDYDGSGVLDADDAIYLKEAILNGTALEQDADVDGDGDVDEDDATYLLMHVVFPEYYPLM